MALKKNSVKQSKKSTLKGIKNNESSMDFNTLLDSEETKPNLNSVIENQTEENFKKNIKESLREKLKEFPDQSGVYLMKNGISKIIYVGKAKNLKQRVRSYFGESKDLSPKTRLLVTHINTIDYILTKTEVEAFLLEASLIKKHRPKYNIRLKDDKNYPYIRVSMKDKFPRLYLARTVKGDGSLYFGPYTRGGSVFETMRFLNQSFQLRDCTDHVLQSRDRPCINHQLGRCTAPCVNLVSPEAYAHDIEKALRFLKGQNQELIDDLKLRMFKLSEEEKFEQAARWRDTLNSLAAILEKQSVVDPNSRKDLDIVTFTGDSRGTAIQFLYVRQGRVLGTRSQFIPHLDPNDQAEDPRDWFVSVINQYYWENIIPDEVLIDFDVGVELLRLLKTVLVERRGTEVHIKFGTTEEVERELLDITKKNAMETLKKQGDQAESLDRALEEIQSKFSLSKKPLRIECYDISNFQGQQIVASQVVFQNGQPAKDQYRLYKIKSIDGPNDFAAMKEVLSRRFKHSEWNEPDLIVVDGGKGQLSSAVRALIEVGHSHIPLVALAKAKTHSDFEGPEVKGSDERFFIPGRQNPILFLRNSSSLRILTQLRDEAHRFAIGFHRQLRDQKSLTSVLDQIEGIGEKRKKILLKAFENIDQIREASLESIESLPSFHRELAERIKEKLNQLKSEG